MVKCKACSREVEYNGGICPACSSRLTPDKSEIANAKIKLSEAISSKNNAKILACRELLAAVGDTESEREYAKYLERTDSGKRNLALAAEYYFSAASKNDAYSAYRYSRLQARRSQRAALFFLKFSGLLGCINAYAELAEYFSSIGKEDIASYYYYLGAEGGDTPSIVALARRYAEGVGVEKNEAYAKWYLDKFTIPPISALKLAYKLRSATQKKPPAIDFDGYREYLKELSSEAYSLGFYTAYYRIVSELADSGDNDYQFLLGKLTAEGVGTDKNGELALGILMTAVMNGSSDAMMYIADGYAAKNSFLPYNVELAFEYYERAAKAGRADAYAKIGEIYYQGRHSESGTPDPKTALACYKLGARLGSQAAKEKYDAIINRRNEYYSRGFAVLSGCGSVTRSEAEEAFRSLAIAAAYGHESAPRALGKCYAYGFGCDKLPREAFKWFLEAARLGDEDSYLSLGLCYAKGFGTRFSYKSAAHYLKLAIDCGFGDAKRELSLLVSRKQKRMVKQVYALCMELIYMKKFDTAFKILTSAEALGYPKLLYTIGCMYEFGLGCDTSKKRANEYYSRAAVGTAVYGSFVDEGARYKSRILKIIKRV